jgi:hypothetical protein
VRATAIIDITARNKCLCFEHLIGVGNDRRDFVGVDHDVVAAPGFESFDLLVAFHDLFRLAVDELPLEPVSGLRVQHVEADAVRRRSSGVQAYGAANLPNL